MQTLETIAARRSHLMFDQRVPSREEILKILRAAVHAPNHHKVQPWRFVVLRGDARRKLGDVIAESLKKRFPQMSDTAIEAEGKRPEKAPVIIAVAVEKPSLDKEIEVENILAVGAAIQNLLLAAHETGLSGTWRTGEAAYDPNVKKFLGLDPDQHLAGLIYLGYPVNYDRESPRVPVEDKTFWLDS